ncbi:MAG: DNA-packaging protein [Bacteroidales bacterium]|nr:DNA-packaging protein [Bacteroidales bacterium]
MKAMTVTQLAAAAGVSRRTMNRWMKMVKDEMRKHGYREGMYCLPPSVVKFLVEHYSIEV